MKDGVAILKPKSSTPGCRDSGIKMDVLKGPHKHFQFSYQVPKVEQNFKVSWTVVYSTILKYSTNMLNAFKRHLQDTNQHYRRVSPFVTYF